jgi:hypothetical protein
MVIDSAHASEDSGDRLKGVEDLISLLPLLYRGLDVNVTFNNISGFEFTPALSGERSFSFGGL